MRSPTMKDVTKGIRSEWSRAWTETVQDCLHLNDVTSYSYLFLLTKTCFRIPPSNIRLRKEKESFSLNLLKRWRGSLLTKNNKSKFKERVTLWEELV